MIDAIGNVPIVRKLNYINTWKTLRFYPWYINLEGKILQQLIHLTLQATVLSSFSDTLTHSVPSASMVHSDTGTKCKSV